MSDFFEIDFLDVKSDSGKKSGDAISVRYSESGATCVHIVDGGYKDTGAELLEHVQRYFGRAVHVDHVVVSHPDGDHARGLEVILEELGVGVLWMLRPWLHASELLHRFPRFASVENLERRLREIYPNLALLEDVAERNNIPIFEPFQGARIGAFTVLAPSRGRYLDLVVDSERTPESARVAQAASFEGVLARALASVVSFARSIWGAEHLPPKETSAENEMSIVQWAQLSSEDIVLTADAGRHTMAEAATYAPHVGLVLPGVNRIQVPHHGSRRNVHTDLLDMWFGPRLPQQPTSGSEVFTAIVSATKDDPDHPRKAVVRGFMHRGARVLCTGEVNGTIRTHSTNAPRREGWEPIEPLAYPQEQETD